MRPNELEELIESHYQEIYRYCYRHVGEREQAQDLTQMTFLRLWQNKERYTHEGKLLRYLYTIAGNLCRDWFKSRKNISLDAIGSDQLATEEQIKSDTALTVRNALAELPFEQRNVVLLHYYHGFTAVEVARITRTPLPTVRYRLHRAVKRLEILLKEERI